MWQYSSGRFEPMYGKTRQGYRGNTPNTPKQLLESFHSYQTFFHRCHKQEALTFSNVSSVKTDDSLVALGNHFYKVVGCSEPHIALKNCAPPVGRSWSEAVARRNRWQYNISEQKRDSMQSCVVWKCYLMCVHSVDCHITMSSACQCWIISFMH